VRYRAGKRTIVQRTKILDSLGDVPKKTWSINTKDEPVDLRARRRPRRRLDTHLESVLRNPWKNRGNSARLCSDREPRHERGIVFRPVRHSVSGLRDLMAAAFVEFVWHGLPRAQGRQPTTLPSGHQPRHPSAPYTTKGISAHQGPSACFLYQAAGRERTEVLDVCISPRVQTMGGCCINQGTAS
jgi:hypothetical protein